jgi:hypothetical protein
MAPLMEGYRSHNERSPYGGVPQRWMRCYSAQRRPQAQRRVDTYWRKRSAAEAKAWPKWCRTTFACEADAQHALATFTCGLQVTSLHAGPIPPTPRYGKRGRPCQGAPPPEVVSPLPGALPSSLAAHAALVAPQRGFLLATNELDECL